MRFILVLLLISAACFGQAHNWGQQLRLGPVFDSTDSTKIKYSVTQFNGADTLYSDAVLVRGDSDEGIYNVALYCDGVSGTADSLRWQARLGHNFRKGSSGGFFSGGGRDSVFVRWGPWKTIFNVVKKDTLYHKTVSPQDSAWFMPAAIRQYRLYNLSADADTVKPHPTEYSR